MSFRESKIYLKNQRCEKTIESLKRQQKNTWSVDGVIVIGGNLKSLKPWSKTPNLGRFNPNKIKDFSYTYFISNSSNKFLQKMKT
jgi:hypothetical protein